MRWENPKRELLDRINREGPYVGIVMAYALEEMALQSSGFFIPNCQNPSVDLSGRNFNIGSIKGTKVIYLIDVRAAQGIVHYGVAGSANNSVSYGDVSIPKYVAFTGSWNWEVNSEFKEMKIGNYNLPKEDKIHWGKLNFKPEEFLSVGKPMKEVFWLEVDKTWFNLHILFNENGIGCIQQGLEFQQCENATSCFPRVTKVEYGLRGVSPDIFLDNAAYRQFFSKEFQVSTVDEESLAVLTTAMSSGVPSIVIRGVSDLAGGKEHQYLHSLVLWQLLILLMFTIKFIDLIGASRNTPVK
ncbi:hypothetical protein MKW92_002400 [Papaver armeniacum]|nr:hypothetical protein MKW92_002400 [Papaver armeniacum]